MKFSGTGNVSFLASKIHFFEQVFSIKISAKCMCIEATLIHTIRISNNSSMITVVVLLNEYCIRRIH